MWRMEAENRLEGRRDPLARVFFAALGNRAARWALFFLSVKEGFSVATTNWILLPAKKFHMLQTDPVPLCTPSALVGHGWVQAGCVKDEEMWTGFHCTEIPAHLGSRMPQHPQPGQEKPSPSLRSSPPKFVTGRFGWRAKGEGCSEGSSDSSCTSELMQPYQLQPLLLLLIRVLHLAPIPSLQSVIKRW